MGRPQTPDTKTPVSGVCCWRRVFQKSYSLLMAKTAQKVVSDLFKQVDAARVARGLSWHALAHEIGSSPATMTRFIAGDNVSLQTYLLLSEFVMEHTEGTEAFKDYTPEQREKMAKAGTALPDGSFPIADCEDLSNAIQAIGRAKDQDKAKAHIKKRKSALGCEDVPLPDGWGLEGMSQAELDETIVGLMTKNLNGGTQNFSVHGDINLPIADRDHDWDGGAAAERVFEHFRKEGDTVDATGVAKAFFWRNDDMPAEEKGAWGLGFADIIGGTLTLVPRGLAAAAGGHGIGQIEGLNTDEVNQVKRKICQGYARVQDKYEDWPDCPHEGDRRVADGPAKPPKDRRDRSDRSMDHDEAVAAAVAIMENPGEPVEGIIAVEGTPSGDGRMLANDSVEWDDAVLPVPLIWDRQEGDHSGMTVGAIAEVWRDGSEIWGRGWLSASEDPDTQAAVVRVKELFAEGAVGNSVALDHVDVELRVKKSAITGEGGPDLPEDPNDLEEDENGYATLGRMMADDALEVTTRGRLRHVAIVDTAALTGEAASKVKLRLVNPDEDEIIEVAASGSLRIVEFETDVEAFEDPQFGAFGVDDRVLFDPHTNRYSVPPTVTDDGRVFGHIAPWGICVRGRPDRCITPPHADLDGFMRGRAPLAGGKRTGTIVVGGSHSAVRIGAEAATAHYDKTGRAVADVRVGLDAYGIWFAGRLRPGASDTDIYAFKASDVSGHWEVGKDGQMTLCGLPAVNVGGFPKGYMTADEVAMAASAALAEEDCGCEEEENPLQTTQEAEASVAASTTLGEIKVDAVYDDERLTKIEATLERISQAVAPLYAAHLADSLPPDEE
jgi:hypothetical protein